MEEGAEEEPEELEETEADVERYEDEEDWRGTWESLGKKGGGVAAGDRRESQSVIIISDSSIADVAEFSGREEELGDLDMFEKII